MLIHICGVYSTTHMLQAMCNVAVAQTHSLRHTYTTCEHHNVEPHCVYEFHGCRATAQSARTSRKLQPPNPMRLSCWCVCLVCELGVRFVHKHKQTYYIILSSAHHVRGYATTYNTTPHYSYRCARGALSVSSYGTFCAICAICLYLRTNMHNARTRVCFMFCIIIITRPSSRSRHRTTISAAATTQHSSHTSANTAVFARTRDEVLLLLCAARFRKRRRYIAHTNMGSVSGRVTRNRICCTYYWFVQRNYRRQVKQT